MKVLDKAILACMAVTVLVLAGCKLFMQSEPDVVIWRSANIPDAWEQQVLSKLEGGTGYVRITVGEARQMNEYGQGRMGAGREVFSVVAAYSKKSGRLVAQWGYSPNPEAGKNGLTVVFPELGGAVVGDSAAKHPVLFKMAPDFSSIGMSWRGAIPHNVTWTAINGQKN